MRMSYIEMIVEILKATRLKPLTLKELANETDTIPKSIKPVIEEMVANGLLDATERPRLLDPESGRYPGGSLSKQYQLSTNWGRK